MTPEIKSITLKTNYPTVSAVLTHIKELNESYRKTFKKNATVELIYSQRGDLKKPTHNLASWYEDSPVNLKEIEFFKQLAAK